MSSKSTKAKIPKSTKTKSAPKKKETSAKIKPKATKTILYIEAEDEITAVIEKVVIAPEKVVAVVLPKHDSVFQSIVNMKLLKRSASEAKKSLVLITSEPAIRSIAGIAGLHIAKTLTTKPEIPKSASKAPEETTISADEGEIVEEGAETTSEKSDDAEKDTETDIDAEETIELDNTDDSEDDDSSVEEKSKAKKLKFKIPDFSSFRLKMGLGITAVVLIIVAWVFGFVILPAATVTINTDTSRIDVGTEFVVRQGIESSDLEGNILMATSIEVEKEDSVTVPATGEKNIGEKATGKVTMTAKNCSTLATPSDVASGSTVISGGQSFVTEGSVSFTYESFDGSCLNFSGETVDMTAVAQGTSANIGSDKTATVTGRSDVSAIAQASGGTDETVTSVSADDIKKAKDQLTGANTADAIAELKSRLNAQSLQPLVETLVESKASTTQTAKEGDEVSEVTVKSTVTYSMSGVSSEELSKLLDASVQQALVDKEQNIRSNGLTSATYQLLEKVSDSEYKMSLSTVATIGPEFDVEAIKQQVTGKELGEVRQVLESRDDVRSVDVEYSHFWVFQTPSNTDKITIVINETE